MEKTSRKNSRVNLERKEKGKTEGGSTSNYYPLIPTPTPTWEHMPFEATGSTADDKNWQKLTAGNPIPGLGGTTGPDMAYPNAYMVIMGQRAVRA